MVREQNNLATVPTRRNLFDSRAMMRSPRQLQSSRSDYSFVYSRYVIFVSLSSWVQLIFLILHRYHVHHQVLIHYVSRRFHELSRRFTDFSRHFTNFHDVHDGSWCLRTLHDVFTLVQDSSRWYRMINDSSWWFFHPINWNLLINSLLSLSQNSGCSVVKFHAHWILFNSQNCQKTLLYVHP